MRRTVALVVLASAGVLAATASGEPILHEYVPPGDDAEASTILAGAVGPEALIYDGEVLLPPPGGRLRADEALLSADEGGGRRDGGGTRFRPDRITELEESLGYYAVFTPTIAPFKRVHALDAVALDADGTPQLVISSGATRAVPVETIDAPPPDGRLRDRFWGSVVLDFSGGKRVVLPTVSPESRILAIRTEPSTALAFEKDGADRFFAVAPSTGIGRVRLVYMVDAPRAYFAAPLPAARVDALAEQVPAMPSTVRRRAEAFASELGLSREESVANALARLTEHFRSFEESNDPPPDGGDIFLDLARSKKGVCRHRAYAFVITAQSLGIPSRFVYNEAHAWVEVRLPDVGWMRIDLGGAAAGIQPRGANDAPRYRPSHPDPLPQPEAYLRAYARVNGSPPAASSSAATSPSGESTPARSDDDRAPLVVEVEPRRADVLRGQSFEIRGRVREGSGAGVGGLRVEMLLRSRREVLLGVTVSGADGLFRATVHVPPDVEVGPYRLVVRTPGDGRFAPAMAR